MTLGADMPTWLQGSDAALMRIVAIDGFHTAHDDSDAPFSVPGTPLQVVIHDPVDGGTYPVDEPPTLDGFWGTGRMVCCMVRRWYGARTERGCSAPARSCISTHVGCASVVT